MADVTTITAYLDYHPEVIWMAVGAVFLIAEVSVAPGIGLLFAGLGGMTIGGLLSFGIISRDISLYLQLAYFFGFTCVWAAALWKPFMKMRKNSADYHNIIGSKATVLEGGLHKGKQGSAKWSGAPMNARISETSSHTSIKEGAEVWVHALEGTTLVVDVEKPK